MKQSATITIERYDELKQKEKLLSQVLRRRFIQQGITSNGYLWFHYFGHSQTGKLYAKLLTELDSAKSNNSRLMREIQLLEEALRAEKASRRWWKVW